MYFGSALYKFHHSHPSPPTVKPDHSCTVSTCILGGLRNAGVLFLLLLLLFVNWGVCLLVLFVGGGMRNFALQSCTRNLRITNRQN